MISSRVSLVSTEVVFKISTVLELLPWDSSPFCEYVFLTCFSHGQVNLRMLDEILLSMVSPKPKFVGWKWSVVYPPPKFDRCDGYPPGTNLSIARIPLASQGTKKFIRDLLYLAQTLKPNMGLQAKLLPKVS